MILPSNMFVLAPLYIYPSSGAWDPLFTSIAQNPTLSFNVVINPNSGPGNTIYPNSDYITSVAKLNSYTNAQTIAYVHTSFGTRPTADVEADINAYSNWAQYTASDIHVDGIFLDEASTNISYVPYMANLYTYIKQTLPRNTGATVITNPGVNIDASFYKYADYVNAFENVEAVWSQQGSSSIPATVRAKSTVVIYSYDASDATMLQDIESMGEAGIAGCFISAQDNYSTMSTSWSTFVATMANALQAMLSDTLNLRQKKRDL